MSASTVLVDSATRAPQRCVQDSVLSRIEPIMLPALVLPIAIWGVLRIFLFEGIQGADDLEHLTYAWDFNRIPANHWELRLPYNLLLALSLQCFGFSEFATAFPNLLGSFMTMIFCGLTARHLTRSNQCMVLTMAIIAILPSDVLESTTAGSTRILGTGLLSMALWCLLTFRSRWGVVVSGLLFGLAINCHETLLFFVVIFYGVAAAFSKELRPQLAMSWMLGAFIFLLTDPLLWWWLTGDPLYRLHVIEQTHLKNLALDVNVRNVLNAQGEFLPEFFIRPIKEFIVSKHYSVLPVLMVIVGLITFRRSTKMIQSVFVAGMVYWVYMAFGSHSPSGYKPIPGTVNYWQPFAIPVSIILGAGLPMIRTIWMRRLAMTMVILPCLVFMSISGSWGQNVEVAKLFLDRIKDEPQNLFITDDRTARAMYILNGFESPPNVRVVPTSKRVEEWHVPAWNPQESREQKIYVLLNSLNDPEKTVAGHFIPDNEISIQWLKEHAGDSIYSTPVGYRPIAFLLPQSLRPGWFIRRPSCDIRYFEESML